MPSLWIGRLGEIFANTFTVAVRLQPYAATLGLLAHEAAVKVIERDYHGYCGNC